MVFTARGLALPNAIEPNAMDAIKFLKAGNYEIRDLLEDLCDSEVLQVRADLLAQLAVALDVHSSIEDEIFYPAFKHAVEREDHIQLLLDVVEEHRALAHLLLPDLHDADIGSEEFRARAKVLREMVERHTRREEVELYPRLKKLMSAADRDALGERLLQRKQELTRENVPS